MTYKVTGVVSTEVGTELKNTVTASMAAGIMDSEDENNRLTRTSKVVADV